jgi:hypothetical protein
VEKVFWVNFFAVKINFVPVFEKNLQKYCAKKHFSNRKESKKRGQKNKNEKMFLENKRADFFGDFYARLWPCWKNRQKIRPLFSIKTHFHSTSSKT